MKSYMLLFLSAGLFMAGCQSSVKQSGNLIINPGFEEITGDFPSGWIPSISKVTDTIRLGATAEWVHAGKKAMEIGRAWTESWEANGIKTKSPITVDPSQ